MDRTRNALTRSHRLWSIAFVFFVTGLPAASQNPDPLAALEVEPNAIQDPAKPMVIRVKGISSGATVHF